MEGIKIYSPGDTYKIKITTNNNTILENFNTTFYINDIPINETEYDKSEGIFSCKIPINIIPCLYCNVRTEIQYLNEFFTVNETITFNNNRVSPVPSK